VPYVGRFAPSPTGPLHLGSLATAVASFLHARQAGGEWLVRIEDVDPPRELSGAAADILRTLEAFGLHWDREVVYQSTRFDAYRGAVRDLLKRDAAFLCSCSRRDIQGKSGGARRYPGTCRLRTHHSGATAVRVRVDPGVVRFIDGLQRQVEANLADTEGDYLIFRRDGLPAYHLAVVLDDSYQGVDTVVRGADLLTATAVHLHLQERLGFQPPRYFHLPVIVDGEGRKLSKQTGAAPVGTRYSATTAARVLAYLGLDPPRVLAGAGASELWTWAIEHWRIAELIGRRSIHSQELDRSRGFA
jgi:glutamyl-Q tRNA(Asp) synthetase